ncbi:MAG: preprotein translocase subunit SecY [Legionellales bacterium]|nr:preprotein translocase subunit SecY [Legionellales bacterium]OUX64329.1 MAG: preprotein translocase subunit SecY [Gammaproteobacteria bacterium TMED281]
MVDPSTYKEIRNRLFFILFAVMIFRLGAHIPVPGVDFLKLSEYFSKYQGGIVGLFNMFSGGAFSRLTIFALGVMPYISASIIMQLLSTSVNHLMQLKKEGDSGRRKISQYTRYLAVVISCIQGTATTTWLVSQNLVIEATPIFFVTSVATLVTGTMFLIWLGEQMTEKGIGNGISLIIVLGIVSRLPSSCGQLLTQVRQGQMASMTLIAISLFVVGLVMFVVFMERAQRKIAINYPKKQMGNKMYGGQSSSLPLKINMAGVIPPIFASMIIMFPGTLINWFGGHSRTGILGEMLYAISPGQPLYLFLFSLAIIYFCFFYTSIMFDPKDIADNLKRSGALVPGIRPGKNTADYIENVMTRLTLVGSIYLVFVSLVPQFLIQAWKVPFYFGGTSLLIIVVVLMDFVGQLQTHMLPAQYREMSGKHSSKSKKGKLTLLR